MKSPACVLTAAVTLLCVSHASHGQHPHSEPASAVAGSAELTVAERPGVQEIQRPLTNEELFRLLFEREAGTRGPANGYEPTYPTSIQDPSAPPPPAPIDPEAEPMSPGLPAAVGPGCNVACGTPGCTTCCEDCPPFWQHRNSTYFEFLYLHARDADVHFSTPSDGLGINRVPIDNALMADPAYDPGYRIGGSFALSDTASLIAAYTWYESSVNDRATLPGGTGFLFPTLVHPNTVNVANDYLLAEADYDIEFQFLDLAGSFLLHGDCKTRIDGIAGFRLGALEQDLFATYSILGTQTVDSRIDFDGFGPRLGISAERLAGRGCYFYGNAFANFLAGQFEAEFVQNAVLAPGAPEVNTGYEDDRIVSLLELELGLGWTSRCRRINARAGYYIAGWFNTVTTSEFIDAVHVDDFNDASGTLTFDGLTARLEYNY